MAKPIVVGVDGTADSLAALSAAAELAMELGARLVVVHVRHDSLVGAGGNFGAETSSAMHEALDEIERTTRECVSDALAGCNLPWHFEVGAGDAATQLITAAYNEQASTIVVGGRSHGVVGGLVVGSVAQKLVRHSPVSVLVVRGGHVRSSGGAATPVLAG